MEAVSNKFAFYFLQSETSIVQSQKRKREGANFQMCTTVQYIKRIQRFTHL